MSLIYELTQGHELARQLIAQLNAPSSSDETKEILAQKIEASYEKALSMVNCNANTSVATGGTNGMLESSASRCASPPSDDSDRCIGEPDASKKRKSGQPRWTQRVRVRPGMALEGSLDDGFSWRKYGQKDILGSKYPRGYYRCIHRSVGGCLATKQVQRSDDDPTTFEITYIGTHTCTNVASNLVSLPGTSDEKNQEQGPPPSMEHLCHNLKQSPQDLLVSFQKDLNVENQHLDQTYANSFPYIPSTSNSNVVFSMSPSVVDNNGVGNALPSGFISPATSRTNFSFPTLDGYKIIQGAPATSAMSSPAVGLDFPFQLDQNFTIDNNGFFPQGP
ncbi:hypothetical protein V6N12_019051 [Hibiscus sabdariffa]|uniref:WRKY domain-containing protein n=1 Tax=Hibiscus sabdariffa TaxID=183260 RepID=A0ABR2BAD2_9ROSI